MVHDTHLNSPSCDHLFPTDIKFVAAVTFTEERFRKDMFDMNSATFKELAHKIKDNVSLQKASFVF